MTGPTSAAGADAAIELAEATAFVWREGELLDRHDYKPWLALWTASGRYIVPTDTGENVDYASTLNVAYDDAAMREARVKRLESGQSISASPSARTVRTISRVVVGSQAEGRVQVRTAQHLVEHKYGRVRLLAADVTYLLTREAGELRLHEKVVRLVNADDALHGIGYLL